LFFSDAAVDDDTSGCDGSTDVDSCCVISTVVVDSITMSEDDLM
jgi:hypothetical protein